jgi:glycosyltransferase involved in cell wall biosynthesis
VILVARLVPLKRIDLFVETIARVAAQVPSIRAVIIGSGPMLEPGRAQAQALGLDGQLRFLGHEPDVFAWLARAKVFLLPSDTEGVSISLIEAMMCGAVPVASDVGDLADVVQHGVSGFLVRDRTADAFAAPIVELLRQEPRRELLSAAAKRTAEGFTPATLAGRWETLLA